MPPAFATRKPATPASREAAAINNSKANTGRISRTASYFGDDPALETNAARMPRSRPTHHVAKTPQPSAKSVGEAVSKTAGCPMVKYSVQTRAVTWSCIMPYITDDTMHSSTILRASVTFRGMFRQLGSSSPQRQKYRLVSSLPCALASGLLTDLPRRRTGGCRYAHTGHCRRRLGSRKRVRLAGHSWRPRSACRIRT